MHEFPAWQRRHARHGLPVPAIAVHIRSPKWCLDCFYTVDVMRLDAVVLVLAALLSIHPNVSASRVQAFPVRP
jgi:hypothetical protein